MTDDVFFSAVLGTRQRLIAGVLGIGLGFGGPFVLSVLLIATSGDPSFVILPLPFLGFLWMAHGLAPSGYTVEAGGVRLERRWVRRLIPYAAIRGCDRRPRRIGGLGGIGLNALFGPHGWRWNPWTGRHYLAITNTRDLVYLDTAAGLVVISPSEPDALVAEVCAHLARAASGSGGPGGAAGPG